MCSFGVIWIRISDQDHSDHIIHQGTDESSLVTNSLVPLTNYDPTDLGSLILIQITPKERSLRRKPLNGT